MSNKYTFTYNPPPRKFTITKELLRSTLERVRDELLSGRINGGRKKLRMETVCGTHPCGTVACIGGWAAFFMAGDEAGARVLFDHLLAADRSFAGKNPHVRRDRLYNLFYGFDRTDDYNEPNVAATAIQRYLDGRQTPWPHGPMPNKLRYKRKRT